MIKKSLQENILVNIKVYIVKPTVTKSIVKLIK